MDCADEAALIRHVLDVPGILQLEFDLVGRRVDVTYDPGAIAPDAIVARVGAPGSALTPTPAASTSTTTIAAADTARRGGGCWPAGP